MTSKSTTPFFIAILLSTILCTYTIADDSPPSGNGITPQSERTEWTDWKKRVADSISNCFDNMINKAPDSRFKGLECSVVFALSKTGEVKVVHLSQKSSNPQFNTMAVFAVQSLNKKTQLQFPANSTAQDIECTAGFSEKNGLTLSTRFIKVDSKIARYNKSSCEPPRFPPDMIGE